MKYSRLILSLTIVCLLLSTVACGAPEPIIETSAGEMNFTAEDLGPEWSMESEQGLSDMMEEIPDHARDANVRSFIANDPLRVFVGMTISTKSVASAKSEMKGAFVQDILTSLQDMGSGGTFEEMAAPEIGDETIMVGGNTTVSGVAMDAYALTFRKANVIAMVFLLGPGEFANEENATDYAQELEARIQ